MVRETRGTVSKDAVVVDSTPSNKRKRRPSDLPSTSSDGTAAPPSLKVVLPSPSSVGATGKSTTIHISPSKLPNGNGVSHGASHGAENGESSGTGEGSAKKQRISLKIGKVNGTRGRSKSKTPALEEVEEGEGKMEVEDSAADPAKGVERAGRVMPEEMRTALEGLLSKMSANLPPPHNTLLKTPLPPDLLPPSNEKKASSQSLETILRSDGLTWERLVTTLHGLSAHLLAPSRYPNPLPSLSHLNVPIPPLPAPYIPFPLYRFFDTLRQVLISIQPTTPEADASLAEELKVERWALLQKGIQHGPSGPLPVEWWSSLLNLQEAERMLLQLKGEGKEAGDGLMAHLAGLGGMFASQGRAALRSGNAIPVAIHDILAGPSIQHGPKLNDSLIRKASHKAARWKEELAKRRKGGFGSVQVPVRSLKHADTDFSWTPSFGPSFDSLYASGGAGFYSTLEGMHQRALVKDWRNRAYALEETEQGWQGTLSQRPTGSGAEAGKQELRSAAEVLRETGEHLEELEAWQFDRVKRGVSSAAQIGDRESALADQVLDSLTSLASSTAPSTFLTDPPSPGAAHQWSSRFISPSLPAVRGTLDPRRPKGIKDNTTARFNARPPSLPTSTPAPSNIAHGSMAGRPYGPGTPGYSQSTPIAGGGYRRPVGRPPSNPAPGGGGSGSQGPGYYTPPNPSNPFSRPGGAGMGGGGIYASGLGGGGNTIYNRSAGGGPSSTPGIYNSNSLARPPMGAGLGPSGLRHSYGPPGVGSPGAPGGGAGRPYGSGGYSPLVGAAAAGMMGRPPMTPTSMR